MKILLKLLVGVFVVFAVQTAQAAVNVTAWSISSPLSGPNLTISSTGQTQVTFKVTCTRDNILEPANIAVRLQASNGFTGMAMHSDVYIQTSDFTWKKGVIKTFTVTVDASKTYYPNSTTVYLAVMQGVSGAPFTLTNTYPVLVYPPITNNIICCSATHPNVNIPSTLTGTSPSGGIGSYTYQWQSATDTLGTWTDIAVSGTGASYATPAFSQTTYFRRIVRADPGIPENRSGFVVIKIVPARMGIDAEQEEANNPVQISLQPNPFVNEFTVQVNKGKIKNIEINNSDGAVVYSKESVFHNQVLVDTDLWPAGIFFVRITTSDNELIVRKIIKR